MENKKNLNSVQKIENIFLQDKALLQIKKSSSKENFFLRTKIKNLLLVPSFLWKRVYKVSPSVLKDIFFWSSTFHKSPSSKILAKTKYEEFRTLLDIKVSALVLNSIPSVTLVKVKEAFNKGYCINELTDISELDPLIDEVVNYASPNIAGARPYLKDGKKRIIEDSFSAYYDFSESHSEKITSFLNKALEEDFEFYLSAIAGYSCKLKNISYSLGIVYGENSNSEMHQDSFSSVAKGFIYLQDTDLRGAPFEYCEGSCHDASFRSHHTNQAVISDDFLASSSTRLRGSALEEALKKFHLKTFIGQKGTFILCNTSGYHRKGAHNIARPRISLNFEVKRKSLFSKLIINIFALIRFRFTSNN